MEIVSVRPGLACNQMAMAAPCRVSLKLRTEVSTVEGRSRAEAAAPSSQGESFRVAQAGPFENESQFLRDVFGSDEQIFKDLKAGAKDAASDLGEAVATGAKLVGPLLVPPVAKGAAIAGRAAAGAGERALVRAATAAHNASFGAGVKAGMAARAIGAPTPQFPGNSQFNAGAKFGATLVDAGKTVVDTLD